MTPGHLKYYDIDQWKMYTEEPVGGKSVPVSIVFNFDGPHTIWIIVKHWLQVDGTFINIGQMKYCDKKLSRYYVSPYHRNIPWKGKEERIEKAKKLGQLAYLKFRPRIAYDLGLRIKEIKKHMNSYAI